MANVYPEIGEICGFIWDKLGVTVDKNGVIVDKLGVIVAHNGAVWAHLGIRNVTHKHNKNRIIAMENEDSSVFKGKTL